LPRTRSHLGPERTTYSMRRLLTGSLHPAGIGGRPRRPGRDGCRFPSRRSDGRARS